MLALLPGSFPGSLFSALAVQVDRGGHPLTPAQIFRDNAPALAPFAIVVAPTAPLFPSHVVLHLFTTPAFPAWPGVG